MREKLFRGKRMDNGEWVMGGYAESLYPGAACIVQTHNDGIGLSGYECIEVIASTVGQYTGLKDKNGKLIFEGDYVEWEPAGYSRIDPVYFEEGGFAAGTWFLQAGIMDWSFQGEIVGNIHDNPELLKAAEKGGSEKG